MSVQTKNNFKRSSKLLGVLLFAFLFFFNIKVILNDDVSRNSDISLFGIGIQLFESTYAEGATCSAELNCQHGGKVSCTGGKYCSISGHCVYCDSVSSCCGL
jgi:hypothetical protein